MTFCSAAVASYSCWCLPCRGLICSYNINDLVEGHSKSFFISHHMENIIFFTVTCKLHKHESPRHRFIHSCHLNFVPLGDKNVFFYFSVLFYNFHARQQTCNFHNTFLHKNYYISKYYTLLRRTRQVQRA